MRPPAASTATNHVTARRTRGRPGRPGPNSGMSRPARRRERYGGRPGGHRSAPGGGTCCPGTIAGRYSRSAGSTMPSAVAASQMRSGRRQLGVALLERPLQLLFGFDLLVHAIEPELTLHEHRMEDREPEQRAEEQHARHATEDPQPQRADGARTRRPRGSAARLGALSRSTRRTSRRDRDRARAAECVPAWAPAAGTGGATGRARACSSPWSSRSRDRASRRRAGARSRRAGCARPRRPTACDRCATASAPRVSHRTRTAGSRRAHAPAGLGLRKRSFTMRSSPEWYESTAPRPCGREQRDRVVERAGQLIELAVDLDAQRLERALRGMTTSAARRRRDRVAHDVRELRWSSRWDARAHDRGGDPLGVALVAVVAQDVGRARPRPRRSQVGRGSRPVAGPSACRADPRCGS